MFDFDELSGALVFFAWLIHPWSDLTITLLYFICLVLPVLVHFFCCVHLAKQMTCPEYSTSCCGFFMKEQQLCCLFAEKHTAK